MLIVYWIVNSYFSKLMLLTLHNIYKMIIFKDTEPDVNLRIYLLFFNIILKFF